MSLLRTTPKNLEALRRADPYEFCVIGSGPAGTVVACDLAEAGHDVLLLESGNGLSEWLFDPKLQNLAAYSVSGTADYPTTKTKARLVGGNSNFWTGRSERLHPSDFETHPYTPVDGGWPIGYEDLDPYYHKAEKTLNVAGGLRSADAPPRDDEHQPLVPPKTSIAYLKNLFAQADTTVDHSPTAKPTRTFRFFNIQKERLAKCLHLSNLTLVSGVSVTKLHSDSGRGVSHALCRTPDLGTLEARAKRFVVACGGIESARLLLLSANDAHPNGLGNQSDMVGRGFNEHPATNFYARVRHTAGTLMPTNKIGRTHQFYSDYRDEGLG